MPGDKPPPLPPREAPRQPYPKAKSDPPPLPVLHPLHDTPPPHARRTLSTPPEGMPLPRRNAEPSQSSPLEDTIRDLRMTNLLLRERLTAVSSLTSPSVEPGPSAPKSKAQIAVAVGGKLGLSLGKYTTLVTGVLGLVDVIVALWFPDYVGPLRALLQLLGPR